MQEDLLHKKEVEALERIIASKNKEIKQLKARINLSNSELNKKPDSFKIPKYIIGGSTNSTKLIQTKFLCLYYLSKIKSKILENGSQLMNNQEMRLNKIGRAHV